MRGRFLAKARVEQLRNLPHPLPMWCLPRLEYAAGRCDTLGDRGHYVHKCDRVSLGAPLGVSFPPKDLSALQHTLGPRDSVQGPL